MRALLILLVVASGLGALAAPSPAQAWYDRWGRWHPDQYPSLPPSPVLGLPPAPLLRTSGLRAAAGLLPAALLSAAPAGVLPAVLSRPGHRPTACARPRPMPGSQANWR